MPVPGEPAAPSGGVWVQGKMGRGGRGEGFSVGVGKAWDCEEQGEEKVVV